MKEQLLALLTENFPEVDFLIPYEEIVPQNFNSLDAMAAMLERLSEA